jgi:uncharacterized lipoprotein YmbA
MKSAPFRFRSLAFSLQLVAVSFLFTACNLPAPQEDLTRYFTLSGPATGAPAPDGAAVRPVRLAGHLRNREMAVRISANEVIYLDEVRWAEPLDDAITQILRQRLRQVAGDVVISVHIQRCELVRNADNAVQVAATYSIMPAGGEARTGVFSSTPRKWAGKDYGALVGLLREGVEELAETVAQAAAKK